MLPPPPTSTLFPYTTLFRSPPPLRPAGPAARTRTPGCGTPPGGSRPARRRSEERTSELQSLTNLVCRLLLEKKKTTLSIHRSTGRTYEVQYAQPSPTALIIA